ncbi:MAG TPA: hypothetical protein DCR04_03070 [Flavobacteriales bacterium]|nr:hypothetical protein [Flavobacteriales bacterium]
MKNLLLALTTLIALGLASCSPDACEKVTCLNDGICESGECACTSGFEGPNCATEQRQAFVGTYSVTESCNLGDFYYDITISADSETLTEITLSNLGDFDFEITGVVNGTSVSFTNQTGNGSSVNGTGELRNGTLTIEYTLVTSSSQTLTCSLTGLIQE